MGLLTRLPHQHLGSISEGKHGAKTSQIIGGLQVYFLLETAPVAHSKEALPELKITAMKAKLESRMGSRDLKK